MAQYSNLKAYIEEKIYENGTQAITGDILQDVLKVMTDDLGEFYQTGGVASPSTDPGTPDAKVIYFATEAGTYTNFGGITLKAGEVALLIFETSWTKETLNVLSAANGGVKTANLADGAVTTEKIAGGAVETAKIANNAVTSGKVADGAIGTAKIADGAIDADKIAANAVESAKIKNGAVTEGKINDGAVTAGKVAANAVTTAKIADEAVTTAKLNDGAVTEDKIATDAVTSGKVKDGAIGTAKIAAGAVTHAKIGAGAVEESNIKDGAVTSDKIANGAVGSDQLAEGAFSAENLADGSVTTDKLADGAVTAEKIADGAVTADKFANGSVTTIKLGSGAVTTEKIGDGMVTRQKLADSSVGTSKIIDGAVTGAKLQEGVRPVINVNALNEETAAYGSAALARAAVPSALRILGLHIIYLLAGGWFEDEYIGSDVSGWGTASNWRAVGPVSVSQNTLIIGGEEVGELGGQLFENPEWVKVVTDGEDKILYGVKTDGKFYFGGGCPPQVQEYVQNIIDGLSLDEYEDIVAFLGNLIDGETLATLLNAKLDAEGLDSNALNTMQTIDNPEFLEVTTDSEDKVIEGIQQDGTKVIGGDLNVGGSANISGDIRVFGNMEVSGVLYKIIKNPEYLAAWVDAENKVIFGLKANGKTYVGDADFLNDIDDIKDFLQNITDKNIDWDALSSITAVENPEYIEAKTDSEGKLLAGRTPDGAAFENVGFSTPKVSIDGHIVEDIEDPEGRMNIETDAEGKILSYRDADGVKHENAGIETSKLTLTEDGAENLKSQLDEVPVKKNWYLPKFGKVNIKSETFYLTADPRWSTIDDVVCIQMYDDTDENASNRVTLSYYYIKSTLTPLAGGGYNRTSVNENSVQLQLFGGKDVVEDNGQYFVKKITKVNGEYYLTSSLVESNGVYDIYYIYGHPSSFKVNYTDSNPDQTTLTNAIEVGQVTDIPPVKAWAVTKMLEHYCVADIDFGSFYSKNNVAVGIKYQGSGTTGIRKRGFRLTYYKNNTYAKKEKVKIGEMIRLSGFNMKSYGYDDSRVKDPILANIFIEMWQTRGKDAFPWNANNCIYNGATGFIKSFPIELDFGGGFYGLYFFGLKKDEKNYMLDGTDESGIFVSGANDSQLKCFNNAAHSDCEDEMMDEMSQSTADALDEFFKYCKGFTDGTIEIDGQIVDFTNDMLEERIELNDFIDYWIGLELFTLWDNSFHNCIIYSGFDKKKFSLYFYDLDNAIGYPADSSYVTIMHNTGHNIQFWEKFISEYKDYIINRYSELRKTVLSAENINAIYKNYVAEVSENITNLEIAKWGTGDVKNFEVLLMLIKDRLDYLDKNGFNLELN